MSGSVFRRASEISAEFIDHGSNQCAAQPLSQRKLYDSTLLSVQEMEHFEQGLQADHTGHKAIKVNGQLAAGVANDNAML